MKRLNCQETIQKFVDIPRAEVVENHFPHYTKGFAFVVGENGAVGCADAESAITDACELLNQYMGYKTFFLFSSFGHYKADWTFCGALVAD